MSVATPYCDLADMQRLFSSQGVTAFSDHDADGQDDAGVTDDCIDEATEEINLFCKLYSTSGLASSTLINRWCTTLACFFLCERRGNPVPDSLATAAQLVRDRLSLVLSGALPLNVAKSVNTSPSFSNMTVDRRFPFSRVRVQRENSDQIATTLTQKLAGEVPVE
jgi:phage gp36-like protein